MAAQDRRVLRRAANLHDVGKLSVSSTIREKPGRVDADEWHVMQNHALHTTEILSRISVRRNMALIAGLHYARLDGAGYHLRRDARIIALDIMAGEVGRRWIRNASQLCLQRPRAAAWDISFRGLPGSTSRPVAERAGGLVRR